jgi:hypothetical protein
VQKPKLSAFLIPYYSYTSRWAPLPLKIRKMKKLTELGFKKAGKWSFENNLFQYELNENYTTKNILHSLIIENKEKIMGKKHKEEIIVKIGEAYYNQGFFNIQSKYSGLFSKNHFEPIKIQIEENNNEIIIGEIYKSQNSNQTRIKAGVEYTKWIQNNFKMGDIFKVEIIEKGFIKLKK